MIFPKFLKQGDTIGVPAPSSGAYDEPHCNKYKNSKKKLEKMGYKVIWSDNIFCSTKARSSDAKTRANEINWMFKNPEINFIMCAAGGEFLVEILPYIDFEAIKQNPKFIQGFSDPTGILFPLTTKYDISTIYGNNFGEYGIDEYYRNVEENLELIKGNLIIQENYDMYEGETLKNNNQTGLEGYNFTNKVEWKTLEKEGNVKITGRIIGGCIDIIAELAGTKYDGTKQFIEKYKKD